MGTCLIAYHSRHGHSANVAEYIGERVRDRGLQAAALHVDVAQTVNLDLYAAVVVVSPVYFGGHSAKVMRFMRERRAALAGCPFAFVSIENSVANADPAAETNAARRLQRLVAETGAHPDVMTTVAGAISYPRYGLGLRLAMKLHSYLASTPTDTSTEHVLTDWNALDRALAPFFASLDRRPKETFSPDESGIHRIVFTTREASGGES